MIRNRYINLRDEIRETKTSGYDHISAIRTVLRRFLKAELLEEILDVTAQDLLKVSHSKRLDRNQIIETIIRSLKDGQDLHIFHWQLELKYLALHPDKRQWYSAEIKNAQVFIETDTNPVKFARKLEKHLQKSKLFCNVFSEFIKGKLWTLLAMYQRQQKIKIAVILLYPGMPSFLFSCLRKAQYRQVFRAITELFQGTVTEQLPFQSRNANAVLRCVVDHLRLEDVSLPESPEPAEYSDENDLPDDVISENVNAEAQKREYITRTFGSNKLPALEQVTYDVTSNYFGFGESTFPTTCRAVLRGRNVLEGMRDLVEFEAATIPLPEYMTNVGTKYGNYISLNQKLSGGNSDGLSVDFTDDEEW